MAISNDTAALVAAQLTQAVMAIQAGQHGVGGLTEIQGQQRVFETYLRFKDLVAETSIRDVAI